MVLISLIKKGKNWAGEFTDPQPMAMRKFLLKLTSTISGRMPARIRNRFYRLGPISKFIRTSLNRAVPDGYTEIEVAAGALSGMKLTLDLKREKDCWLGNYEPELQEALEDFAGDGMTIYDIGASIREM